jgi:tetratricopeptide (TPR) repeat protein
MGLKQKLDELLAGTLDSATAQAESLAREDLRRRAFKLATPLQKAIESKDWDKAISMLDEIVGLDAEMFAPSSVAKLRLLMTGKQDKAAATAHAMAALERYNNNANVLADMAVVLLTQGDEAVRDAETAGKLSARAMELAPERARSMRAQAEWLWATGKHDEARALIEKALGAAGLDEAGDVALSAKKMAK